MEFSTDNRFAQIKPFDYKIWLSSPTMHGDEQKWVDEAIHTNWVSTIGANIDEVEKLTAQKMGRKYGVALSSGTAALHLAVRLAGERLYGAAVSNRGVLEGRRVFCSDMTFDATVNPVAYEGGECVFIDTGYDDWNMDPKALEAAFDLYPDVRLIVMAHLYGTPSAHINEIREIANRHGTIIIEDAAESLGASVYKNKGMLEDYGSDGEWIPAGCCGDYSIVSFNGNKIITGSSGGMFLVDDIEDALKIRKWSTQAREAAPWYQHEELGYNYRMSNVVAGIVRGQIPYLSEHIDGKRRVWERYQTGLKDLPVSMNPIPAHTRPNYWLSCLMVEEEAMCPQVRSERESLYVSQSGRSCPDEILAALKWANCEGRPIWKPMHLQPIYRNSAFVTRKPSIRTDGTKDVGADIFNRGLCLPSDNKMTAEEQKIVIDIIHRCFQ